MPGCSVCSRRRSWASCLRSRQPDARLQTGLRIIGAGGSGMRLGKTWTILIVAQVGFAVALLPAAVSSAWEDTAGRDCRSRIRGRRVSLRAAWDGLRAGHGRSGRRHTRVHPPVRRPADRADAPPGSRAPVSSVTFAMVNPGDEPGASIETQDVARRNRSERLARSERPRGAV